MPRSAEDPFAEITDASIVLAARAVHELYLEQHAHAEFAGHDRAGAPHPAMYQWDDPRLSPELKRQNYDQVRANVLRLHELGYQLVPLADGDSQEAAADDLTRVGEALARMEHDRWCLLKRRQGYTYGPTRMDGPADGLRQHPDLRDWDQLDDTTRAKDVRPISTMLAVLRQGGLGVITRA